MLKNHQLKLLMMFCSKPSYIPITTQNQQNLLLQFLKQPSIKAFPKYFHKENFIQLFKIVKESRIPPNTKIQNFQTLEELCQQSNETDLGMLTIVKCEKAQFLMGLKKYIQALQEIQQASTLVGLRDNINPIQAAHVHRVAADVYMQLKEYPRAIKSLQEAEAILTTYQDPTIKDRLFSLAEIYTVLAMASSHSQNFMEAREYMGKSMENWDELGNKVKYPSFGSTVMFKCTLHRIFNQLDQACQEAQSYLPHANQVSRMWLISFLFSSGRKQYEKEYQEVMRVELEKLGPEKAEQVMQNLQKQNRNK